MKAFIFILHSVYENRRFPSFFKNEMQNLPAFQASQQTSRSSVPSRGEFQVPFVGDCIGQRFGVDQSDVSADPAQVACGPFHRGFQRAVRPPIHVFLEVDVAIGVQMRLRSRWLAASCSVSVNHGKRCATQPCGLSRCSAACG
jgi:hypothetical protein